jgi:hypothetical protein
MNTHAKAPPPPLSFPQVAEIQEVLNPAAVPRHKVVVEGTVSRSDVVIGENMVRARNVSRIHFEVNGVFVGHAYFSLSNSLYYNLGCGASFVLSIVYRNHARRSRLHGGTGRISRWRSLD